MPARDDAPQTSLPIGTLKIQNRPWREIYSMMLTDKKAYKRFRVSTLFVHSFILKVTLPPKDLRLVKLLKKAEKDKAKFNKVLSRITRLLDGCTNSIEEKEQKAAFKDAIRNYYEPYQWVLLQTISQLYVKGIFVQLSDDFFEVLHDELS